MPLNTSLREVLVAMIEEHARQMGHVDLLRERIDDASVSSVPPPTSVTVPHGIARSGVPDRACSPTSTSLLS